LDYPGRYAEGAFWFWMGCAREEQCVLSQQLSRMLRMWSW
jgi:hypothetical protein